MTDYSDLAIIILAAGKGTRMKSDLPKVLHKINNKSMLLHVIECAGKLNNAQIHVVIGHRADEVKRQITPFADVAFAHQKHLLGTGDAVKAALPGIAENVEYVLVLCGDVPLIRPKTLIEVVTAHKNGKAVITVLAADVENPTGYGRILQDEMQNVIGIREEADASAQEKMITRVNTGIFCFQKDFLISAIQQLKPENNQSEYYLTDTITIARTSGKLISAVTTNDPDQVMGVNTLAELARAEHLIKRSLQ